MDRPAWQKQCALVRHQQKYSISFKQKTRIHIYLKQRSPKNIYLQQKICKNIYLKQPSSKLLRFWKNHYILLQSKRPNTKEKETLTAKKAVSRLSLSSQSGFIFKGKSLYHLIVCRFYNNDQWLTIVECMFLLYQPIRNVTYKITHVLCTILLYHPIFTISTILSLAAPAMPLFHGDSGTP